ncbi:MAG: hypothetical protein ACYC04_01765 [Sulfurovum sp.]
MRFFLFLTLFGVMLFARDILERNDGVSDEAIHPSAFKVKLIKRCEVLVLNEEPNRKAKKIYTRVWTEECVQNYGCMREITQKELDGMDEVKRNYMAWKYPTWCKVNAKGKIGWVRKQFLSDEPCKN